MSKNKLVTAQERFCNELILLKYEVYTIRITYEQIDNDDIMELFNEFSMVVTGQERTSKGLKHFHVYVAGVDISVERIRKILKDKYPDIKGNKHLMIKAAVNPLQLLKYVVKEGNCLYKGLPEDLIKECKKTSYSKDKKAFVELDDKYLTTRMDIKEYTTLYVELKVNNNQPLYDTHLIAHVKKMAIKKGEYRASDYADRILGLANLN